MHACDACNTCYNTSLQEKQVRKWSLRNRVWQLKYPSYQSAHYLAQNLTFLFTDYFACARKDESRALPSQRKNAFF